jgi:hypothetical protein
VTEPISLERVENALFNRLLMATGTVLYDHYKEAFVWFVEHRAIVETTQENEVEKGQSLELYPVEDQATV